MNPEERVGVVIPTYNTGELVAEAAGSAALALGSLDHIVIVDDGSTDKATRATLIRLERDGYTALRQPNAGVSAARNAGLATLAVPYAFALDSDDLLDIKAPTLAADVLDSHPDVAIVTGSGVEFDEAGNRTAPIPPGSPTRQSMRRGSLIATASAFRLADWRECGGFPEGMAVGEDWVFWMRLLRKGGRIAVLDETFVYRKMHAGQVTRRYVDPRQSAKAINLVMAENPDLALAHPDELLQELAQLRSVFAEYRFAYHRLDRAKEALRSLRRHSMSGSDA